MKTRWRLSALCSILLFSMMSTQAGPIADAIKERMEKRRAAAAQSDDGTGASPFENSGGRRGRVELPAGARALNDLAYGDDPGQKLDVYIGKNAHASPIVLLVHGGAWMFGDKQNSGVVAGKIARWLPKNYIVVSANYRMSRSPNALDQADDIGRALAYVQSHAADWGGSANSVLLMGHSAGAHLVALLAADRSIAQRQGAKDWLGTVALDSAALDLVEIMERKHYGFYDRVFGAQRAKWLEASPYHRMQSAPGPLLLVCSSKRSDSCPPAQAFAKRAIELGGRATVVPVDLTHGDIMATLGAKSAYTEEVEKFMRGLGMP